MRQGAPGAELREALTERGQSRHAVAQVAQPRHLAQPGRVARQPCDQPLVQADPVFFGTRGEHLDLHARHVYPGRALAAARLARDAQLQRLVHRVGGQGAWPELARDCQAQRVGAAAHQVALVACHPVGGAHDAIADLAAGAIVVAHLVDLRGADDLAGVEQAGRVEAVLDLLEALHHALAEHVAVELGAGDAVAVFAGVRAAVLSHHLERLFGDGTHRLHVAVELEVEHRAHVQRADRGVGVPGAVGVVLVEDLGQPAGVLGEVLEAHRAVLDERHRFAVRLHRHHDVEALLAHLPDRFLQGRIHRVDDAATGVGGGVPGVAQVTHQGVQVGEPSQILGLVGFGELDQQQRARLAAHHLLHHRLEHRDVARQLDHGAVDQLHRGGSELDDVLWSLHRGVEGREVADAQRAVAQQRRQAQVEPLAVGQCPL